MASRQRVHEPGCRGAHACGGYVVCSACGRRFGWCSGDGEDRGRCPDCCLAGAPVAPEHVEAAYGRGPDGRIRYRRVVVVEEVDDAAGQ